MANKFIFLLVRNVTHDSEEAAIWITSDGRCAEDIIYTSMQEQLCYAMWLVMIFTHSQLLISRGRWSIVDLHDLIPDLIFQLSIVAVHVCVCALYMQIN